MATTLSSTTFSSEYNDDYRDSDHYHRILFNNGRALQARELTQLQTIIQSEMARIANYLFTEAAPIFAGGSVLSGAFSPLGSVRVEQLPDAPSELIGLEISNSLGVKAVIKEAIAGDGEDDVILVAYTNSGDNQADDPNVETVTFKPGQELSYTLDGAQTLNVKLDVGDKLAIGKGSMIETPQYDTYVAGHMIMVEAQSLVIDKFSSTPTEVIGFYLTQRVITADDNIALYDNSGVTPNLTSPGADRLQITLTLAKKSDYSGDADTFFELFNIEKGVTRFVNEADNTRGIVQQTVNDRTYDIMGDFTVRNHPAGEFKIQILDDSDADYLNYKVEGGVAFVKGSRIDRNAVNLPKRVKKPRETNNYVTINNEFTPTVYGNFLLADSINGLIKGLDSFQELSIKSGADLSGDTLGTLRIHTINEYDNAFRLHVFDVDLTSGNSLENARSIGTGSGNYANLTLIDGVVTLNDQDENSLLFPHPRKRVNNVDADDITLVRYKLSSSTTNGSGEATFSATSGATWTDPENWIAQVDSSGEIFSPPSYSGSLTNNVTLTGLPHSSAITLYGLESKTAQLKFKQLNTANPNKSVDVSETVSVVNGEFVLSKADIYRFKSVTDDTTSQDITNNFRFDNGQRDFYYGRGRGKLKNGYSAPAGTVTVNYDYYHHTAGDLFTGYNSYNATSYERTPTYTTSSGKHYRLTDVIDMRSVKGSNGTFSGSGAVVTTVPRSGTNVTMGEIQYWLGRRDLVALLPNGYIDIKQGKAARDPLLPSYDPDTELPLHAVTLYPYTLNQTDLEVSSFENRGYTMSDIRNLERRIENVEELTSLTMSELDLISASVYDPTDPTLDRLKQGITGDGFKSNFQSQMIEDDYRARVDNTVSMLSPITHIRSSSLYYDSDRSLYTVLKGSSIWPVYTEEVYINQNQASSTIDVNAFPTNKYIGTGEVIPAVDKWNISKEVDNTFELGDAAIVVDGENIDEAFKVIMSQGESLTDAGLES